jgi:KUP system potassium uptake protein
VVLATVATVIASQAVITGAFSFTRQASSSGFCRVAIRHTSESIAGQIYLPRVNQLLFVGVLLVTLTFRAPASWQRRGRRSLRRWSSTASAFFVVWRYWGWPVWKAALLMVPLLQVEQEAFLAANVLKIQKVAGFLAIALAITLLVLTVRGSASLGRRRKNGGAQWLVRKLEAKPRTGCLGPPCFYRRPLFDLAHAQPRTTGAARAQHHPHHQTEDTPRVPRHERIEIDRVAGYFHPRDRTTVSWRRRACRRSSSTAVARTSTSMSPLPRSSCRGARSDDHEIGDAALAGRLFIWLANSGGDATGTSASQRSCGRVGTQVMV